MIAFIFWISAALLVYTYAAYPLLLSLWARWRERPIHRGTQLPSVSIIVVAYNEADRIAARLANLLTLDYPRERVEIILVSDGSTDDTAGRAMADAPANVRVVDFPVRRGKAAVLNELIPMARNEIVLLADARQRFDTAALRVLVAHFSDPMVGAVSGELILHVGNALFGANEFSGWYWRYEKALRRNESRIDSTVGVTGAIYALRKSLFLPIAPDTILDDVLIPMLIVRQGYRVTFETQAIAHDLLSSASVEFQRKTRTLAGNFQLILHEPWLLNPFANRLWWATLSHKLARLLAPIFLLSVLVANAFLLSSFFYRYTLFAQAAFYLAALLAWMLPLSARKTAALKIPFTFCLLNLAVVIGFLRFVRGRQLATWASVHNTATATAPFSDMRPSGEHASSCKDKPP